MRDEDKRDPQTYALIGAAMEVHRQLGHGFLEVVYQQASVVEYGVRSVPFEREVLLPVIYKGVALSCHYKVDFICFGEIIVELKALSRLTNNEEAQVINYLKASGLSRALLINFGASSLEYRRLVLTHTK